MWGFIKIKLTSISAIRWLASAVLAVAVSIYFMSGYCSTDNPSFQEFCILLLNNKYYICYVLGVIHIVLCSDCYNPTNSLFDDTLLLRFPSKIKWLTSNIFYILVLCALMLFLVILSMCTYFGELQTFFMPQSIEQYYSQLFNGITIGKAIAINLVLIYLRFVFLGMNILLLNMCSKNLPLGFLGPLSIVFIDIFFYETFYITQPLFILPLEHTRIFFTEAAVPILDGTRVKIEISFIYWFLLIAIEYLLLCKIVANKDYMVNKY